MPSIETDGYATNYEITGSGEPLLLFSPGGFEATLDNWSTMGRYRQLRLLDHLSERYTCVAFDRRESGGSGGRLERLTWDLYARQAVALLDHLGIETAHMMGGCVGCSSICAVAVAHPARVSTMVLFSPAGGPRYRMRQHRRFGRHLAFTDESGCAEVVRLALSTDSTFLQDPRVGPWAGLIRADTAFAETYGRCASDRYRLIVEGTLAAMFDRDTVAGARPEDLMLLDIPALIVPGQDASHATSAARYLHECLAGSEYWDVPVAEQTEDRTAPRIIEFLAGSTP